jgi:FkbM family methyltransferase
MVVMASLRTFLKFERPWMVLGCYFRKRRVEGPIRLRGGGTLSVSSYNDDIVSVFVVFCKEEYGTDFEGKTVLDIGANIGTLAVLACRHGCRRLVAVEPSPEAYSVLVQNLTENGFADKSLAIHAAVCGTARGPVPFPVASSALNSLSDAVNPQGRAVVNVPCLTLGALLEEHFGDELDLLKMDCEGAEIEIVAQASDTDLRRIREIRMEFHGPDIEPTLQRLLGLGFRVVGYDRAGPDNVTLWLRRD